jgi:hypothetical protein
LPAQGRGSALARRFRAIREMKLPGLQALKSCDKLAPGWSNTESGYMRNKSNLRFLPLILLPAILPGALLPVLSSRHVPDNVLGGLFGFLVGLSAVGLFWIVRNKARAASDQTC